MASIRLIFLVTLLAALVFAAPAPAQKRNLAKRSFKVPRSLNRAHPRGLNGFDAMKKVAMKYNLVNLKEGFIDAKKNDEVIKGDELKISAAKNGTNGTGTVAATPEQNAALFLSPVDIGGQTVNLDFDSGSSDLLVILLT